LANDGVDTRTIQAYLGHKSIQHTVRYTELAPTPSPGKPWRNRRPSAPRLAMPAFVRLLIVGWNAPVTVDSLRVEN
jgi:hypothetical protein